MDRGQIEEIIFRVLSQWKEDQEKELPLEFPVEVSARHVHLTEEDIQTLFGPGAGLTPKRPLSQPGQFLSEERVSLVTAKGRIDNVAVLGPARAHTQTELSITDCRALGIDAPLRMSGDLRGAGNVYIFGPKGMVHAKGSVIIAQAHIHITPDQAEKIGIRNGQEVSVTLPGERRITMNNVICRVSKDAGLAMHIDFDEANGCMLKNNSTARMRSVGKRPLIVDSWGIKEKENTISVDNLQKTGTEYEGKLITEAVAYKIVGDKVKSLTIKKGMILTPSAKDVLSHGGVKLLWQTGRESL